MRLASLVVATLLSVPIAAAAPICAPLLVGSACAEATAGTSVGLDLFLFLAPGVSPDEWRSAHVAAGPGGAGAALHGYGASTSGPLELWAGASGAGPYGGAYFCVGLAPYVPAACGDPLSHVFRIASLVP